MPNVSIPGSGLTGNSNYFLYSPFKESECTPVTDLSVTIEITQDVNLAGSGLSIQLNGNSPKDANPKWQQYCIGYSADGGQISATIENWIAPKQINETFPLLTLPGTSPTLPAGYQFTIGLSNDASGNIAGATFTVVDNRGNLTSSGLIELTHLQTEGGGSVTPAMLAPFYAFQLVIVGKDDGDYIYLSSGAGAIIYSATSPLMAATGRPTCAAFGGTIESSNSAYGELPEGSSTEIVQPFSTTLPPTYVPGGRFAVSRQFGTDQTNFYGVCRTGQVDVFSVEGHGHWRHRKRLGTPGMSRPYAAVAAVQGATNQTDVFVVGQEYANAARRLYMFSVKDTGEWSQAQEVSRGPYQSHGNLAASRLADANQTGVFLIDSKEQLNVFSIPDTGTISPTPKLIGTPTFPASAPLAASQRFGVPKQTDLFVIDKVGQLNVVSAVSGAWGMPQTIGPKSLFVPGAFIATAQHAGVHDRTDVFLVDKSGQLIMFWVRGSRNWSDPVQIGEADFAVSGAPVAAAQQPGVSPQTDVFLIDKTGTLYVFWLDASGLWYGPKQIGPPGLAPSASTASPVSIGSFVAASAQFGEANRMDVFVLNETGTNAPGWPAQFWIGESGPWNGPLALVTEV
jgi:hypothetical protein